MRHHDARRKFGLKKGPRRSFLKVLAHNFIQHEKITTTVARAKELRAIVERFVSYGKKQNVNGLRLLREKLPKDSAYKVYHEISPRYRDRNGGYTRVIKRAKARKHDGADMATIEFV